MSGQTVLVIGATGNIGTSAITAVLRHPRSFNVLAIVRSEPSKRKLLSNLPSGLETSRITFATTDVTSPTGVQTIVDRVQTGELPTFQHVWCSVGCEYVPDSLLTLDVGRIRENMTAGFETAVMAFQATVPYLRQQQAGKEGSATWTLCTGSQGTLGVFPLPAMVQGALFSFAAAAARECEGEGKGGVRFNEVYLGFRVEVDRDAAAHGVTTASEFGSVYRMVLDDERVRGARVLVEGPKDMGTLRWEKKF